MDALVYTKPKKFSFEKRPMPEVPEGYGLVKIMASGICGSDMHAFLGQDERRPAPFIFGHEAAGIVQGGPLDQKRVTINPLNSCGKCDFCLTDRNNLCAERKIISMPPRQGAFAQYVAIPFDHLIDLPDGVSFEQAALAEPLACGWHAVRLGETALHPPLSEATTLVLGGGAIGLGVALVLKAKGCANITIAETNQLRRETLENIGGFNVIDPTTTSTENVDLVIDCVGYAATRAAASAAVKPGGVILHIGLGQAEGGIDVRRHTLQEITFIGTYAYTAQDFRDTAQAIFDGSLGALDWMDHRPLSKGQAVFDDIMAGKIAAPKTILHPWE